MAKEKKINRDRRKKRGTKGKKSVFARCVYGLLIMAALAAVLALCINAAVVGTTKKAIGTGSEKKFDCILVLGAGVRDDGTPSHMLEDRLKTALKAYNDGVSDRIIVSGDHGREGYDEVNAMKKYLTDAGVPSEAVFMDHAGFSTYESLVRAKDIFLCESVMLVTQKYHLYRALYIANGIGLEAYGDDAAIRVYAGETYREVREIAARVKDFFTVIFRPKPTYLGETIPVSGDGNITNDGYSG